MARCLWGGGGAFIVCTRRDATRSCTHKVLCGFQSVMTRVGFLFQLEDSVHTNSRRAGVCVCVCVVQLFHSAVRTMGAERSGVGSPANAMGTMVIIINMKLWSGYGRGECYE